MTNAIYILARLFHVLQACSVHRMECVILGDQTSSDTMGLVQFLMIPNLLIGT